MWPHYCSVVEDDVLTGNVTSTQHQSMTDSLRNDHPKQTQAIKYMLKMVTPCVVDKHNGHALLSSSLLRVHITSLMGSNGLPD